MQTKNPRILGVALATPPVIPQADVRAAMSAKFPRLAGRLSSVYDNASITNRALSRDPSWYMESRGFGERNAAYVESARGLAVQAAHDALSAAQADAASVDAVCVVSTTGLATPSLAVELRRELGLRPDVQHVPLWGYGCAGGALGLARAAELIRAGYRRVLLVAVEVCSTAFLANDESAQNFVSGALFSDGAAAVVLGAEGTGPSVAGSYSELLPDTEAVTGWDVTDEGLSVVIGQEIPTLVASKVQETAQTALQRVGWDTDPARHLWLFHAGGTKVMQAVESTLGVHSPDSWAVLNSYGNMSSVTVLAALERAWRRGIEGRAVLLGMGPGFALGFVMIEGDTHEAIVKSLEAASTSSENTMRGLLYVLGQLVHRADAAGVRLDDLDLNYWVPDSALRETIAQLAEAIGEQATEPGQELDLATVVQAAREVWGEMEQSR